MVEKYMALFLAEETITTSRAPNGAVVKRMKRSPGLRSGFLLDFRKHKANVTLPL